uniref:Bicaudal D homolog 1a n=1 Tax=Eptatretus burgeri TaxID=7764 RepID=A0A8C4QL10_EPTBU
MNQDHDHDRDQLLFKDPERLHQDLIKATLEKQQAAQYGLAVLQEKQDLQQKHDELEAEVELVRMELLHLREALGQACSKQKEVAEAGENREESLIQESASKEANYVQKIVELQMILKNDQLELANSHCERERLMVLMQELKEVSVVVGYHPRWLSSSLRRPALCRVLVSFPRCLCGVQNNDQMEMHRMSSRDDIKEYKLREARLLQDYSELEEENVSLQKQVSSLKQNQVEYEALKHEIKRFGEETELLHSQLEDALRLKEIGEQQLLEALDGLKTERELKNALRKEMGRSFASIDVSFPSSAPAHLVATIEGLRLAEENGMVEDMTTSNGHDWQNDGEAHPKCKEAQKPLPSLEADLFSELSLSEVEKLKQQLMQVEREKTTLQSTLQESRKQLENTQGALSEQEENVSRLTERINSLSHLQVARRPGDRGECPGQVLPFGGPDGSGILAEGSGYYEVDKHESEMLECKYQVVILELAKKKALEYKEHYEVDNARHEAGLRVLDEKVSILEEANGRSKGEITNLKADIKRANDLREESRAGLALIQDELLTFSEDLAQLYHHICVCNNETPNRVMLDFHRIPRPPRANGTNTHRSPLLCRREKSQGHPTTQPSPPCIAAVQPSPPQSDTTAVANGTGDNGNKPEPSGLVRLLAMVREQMRHLQQAVERSAERSLHRAAAHELAPLLDRDKETLLEELLKLRSLLSTKREQIATLRAIIKANRQTAETTLVSLKSKYEAEKSMVTETMTKLRSELKALKQDAATFSSLRAMFATRCDEYVSQLDKMQRQLAAAEDEKKTLNSLLRMAIQQKLALTQRLEDLEFDQEQYDREKSRSSRKKMMNPKASHLFVYRAFPFWRFAVAGWLLHNLFSVVCLDHELDCSTLINQPFFPNLFSPLSSSLPPPSLCHPPMCLFSSSYPSITYSPF